MIEYKGMSIDYKELEDTFAAKVIEKKGILKFFLLFQKKKLAGKLN